MTWPPAEVTATSGLPRTELHLCKVGEIFGLMFETKWSTSDIETRESNVCSRLRSHSW